MHTLLIDDDPFALRMLACQLEQLGCGPVTPCESAIEALSMLDARRDEIGLVSCDLQMPDIDGVEVVRHLARIGYRGDLVLVSGEDERLLYTVQKLAQARGIRLLGTLQKPVVLEQLRKVLALRESQRITAQRATPRLYEPQDLERAIAGAELVNHYQPQVEMATGSLIGVETLVRWQHPQDGLVYPDQFIATAEDHGLVDKLTYVVLRAALLQSRLWQETGVEVQMAVNVSMISLAMLDFPDVVSQMADESGVPLSHLTLEITESRLMRDIQAPLDIVTRLRLKRIGLSLDDFGTGHSSLAQLRDLPFDELKLDRSFVQGSHSNPALHALVEATLNMARQLRIKSVAEGVEDRADWDFLRGLGCDVAQGYFIARPMTGDRLLAWLEGWKLRRHDLTVRA